MKGLVFLKNNIDIDVIIDDKYDIPKITIYTKNKNEQVENIINAIEASQEKDYPFIKAYKDDKLELISQRDIVRIHTEGRQLVLDTDNDSYVIKSTLKGIEDYLNGDRFIKISQSEVISLYKVKNFDIKVSGTILIEFDNGTKSYVSRRNVKTVKEFLKERGNKDESKE